MKNVLLEERKAQAAGFAMDWTGLESAVRPTSWCYVAEAEEGRRLMSKKRYLEAEMLKEFLRMGMQVGHIHTLRDVENYIDTQPEATPQEVPVNAGEIPSMTRDRSGC